MARGQKIIKSETLQRIGSTIKDARRRLNVSQLEVSQHAGIDRAYLSSIETGKQNMTIAVLEQIGTVLGLRLSQMVGDL